MNISDELSSNELNLYNSLLSKIFGTKLIDAVDQQILELKKSVFGETRNISLSLLNKFKFKLHKDLEAKQVTLSADKISRIFLEIYCSGFKSKSIIEKIHFLNKQGDAANYIELMIQSDEIKEILEHFSEFSFDIELRLSLCKKIAQYHHKLVAENFDKLGLESATIDQRLELCKSFKQWDSDMILDDHFLKLGFIQNIASLKSLHERIELSNKIEAAGRWGHHFFLNMDQLGLMEDLINLESVLERLELFTKNPLTILWSAKFFVNFDKLEFIQNLTAVELIEFCKKIIQIGPQAASALANNIDKFGLLKLSFDQRFELCESIMLSVATYDFCPESNVITHFKKFGLNDRLSDCLELWKKTRRKYLLGIEALGFIQALAKIESTEERLNLCKEFSKLSDQCARDLISHYDHLGLEDTERLIELYQIIAQQSYWAALELLSNIRKLRFEKSSPEGRLELCNVIIQTSIGENDELCKMALLRSLLIQSFSYLNIEDIPKEELINLYKKILREGNKDIASAFKEDFDKLGLQNNDEAIFSFIECARLLDVADTFADNRVFSCLSSDRAKRQMLAQLLKPPSKLWQAKLISDFQPFINPIFSAINILCTREELPFDQGELNRFESFLKEQPQLSSLVGVMELIKAEKPWLQSKLVHWLAFAASLLYDLNEKQGESIQKSKIIEHIFKHGNPTNRYIFIDCLVHQLQNFPSDFSLTPPKNKNDWNPLARLMLSPLKGFGLREEHANVLLEKIRKTTGFKDTNKLAILIQFISAITLEGPYSHNEIDMIAKAMIKIFEDASTLFDKSSKKENTTKIKEGVRKIDLITTKLAAYNSLYQIFGRTEFFKCLSTEKDIRSLFEERFKTLFNINIIENFAENYQKTFGQFRNPLALFTYYRSVNAIHPRDRDAVMKALNVYVNSVLTMQFSATRYNPEMNPHIKKIFDEKPQLKDLWLAVDPPKDILTTEKNEARDYKKFFEEKILIDKHLNPDEFPLLVDYLKSGKLVSISSEKPKKQFQVLAIQLCERKIGANEFVEQVRGLKDLYLGEFSYDLTSLIPKQIGGGFKISETDDPCDLLLIGTEVQGSCQRVNGSPHLNMCLIGYLMNGEVRAIAVKKGDNLVARSIIRLLWDSDNQTPVLLPERVYSNVHNSTVNDAILEWAKEKAKKMGVPLVSKDIGKGLPYKGKVQFLGGFAPFIYCDAGGGTKSGPFTIEECHQLELALTDL